MTPIEELVAYINGLFESRNDVPVTRPWFDAEQWKVMKECMAAGVPLDHELVSRECAWRRKCEAYGDELRAESPIPRLHKEE